MTAPVVIFAGNLPGVKKKIDMSHRRSHVIGKGSGAHAPEVQNGNKRPKAPVKPVISGKPIRQPEVGDGCAGIVVGIIIAAIYVLIS